MKKKIKKIKVRYVSNRKRLFFDSSRIFNRIKIKVNLKPLQKRLSPIRAFFRRYKYWFSAVFLVVIAVMSWQLSSSWMVRSSFPRARTFPKAMVMGTNVGGLDAKQLDEKIAKLVSDFADRKIILVNDGEKWSFGAGGLGLTFDAKATAKAVLDLNKLSLKDKYRLSTGDISSVITPVILADEDKCVSALSVIPVVQAKSEDASISYDNGLQIKADKPGTEFSAVSTCRDLPTKLANNSSEVGVSLNISQAGMTKADLESALPKIQSMVGETLLLKSSGYQLTLTSKQLFDMLEIAKNDSGVQVNWSASKLDEVVSGIASKTDTYDGGPALGSCQYLISAGGDWLDKAATKKIFEGLANSSQRTYDLTVSHHAAQVGAINPAAPGNNGTIYLTFDDGMTYGNQIMNDAACYGVKITFFEIGERAASDAAGLRRAIAEGHAVQSHGHYHALYDYGQRSYDWQYNDMRQSIADIQNITGVRPTYFRPPGGNRSSTTYSAASANGLKLVLWGVSSGDGANISTSLTCSNVLSHAFDGATVLLHSTHASTANAVPCIIEGLAARGYNMAALR